MAAVDDLLYLMARLRDPDTGCPWDLKQDFRSIVPHTLEECFELADTIERGDFEHLREELGDVLFQVVFYSRMGEEQGLFDFEAVAGTLVDKLVRRHPHVFPDGELYSVAAEQVEDEAGIKATWESIKQAERSEKARHGLLADIPLALPALIRANKLQKRASRAGFDWREVAGVLDKVREEADELQADIDAGNREGMVDELGDLLFAVVNLARHLDVEPESALRQANRKFETRFARMEDELGGDPEGFQGLSEAELDQLWERAKKRE